MRRAFTLTELLIVMMILGIMTGLALSGLAGAIDLAKEQRTRAIIAKLDQLVGEQYEDYRTRSVPVNQIAAPSASARTRLYGLRELMRMEMPDRVTDVVDGPAFLTTQQPSAWKAYRRMAQRCCGVNWATTWTEQFQGSECLYMIVSRIHDGDKSALDYFLSGEIGDTDGDGMKEILDGWGNPIEFLRWAPGFTIENGALTTQSNAYTTAPIAPSVLARHCEQPDPFDPGKADPRWVITGSAPPYAACFALRPLIFSAGRDKKYDVATILADASGNQFRYSTTTIQGGIAMPNDPYFIPTVNSQKQLGTQFDADGDGVLAYGDNITNHYVETP